MSRDTTVEFATVEVEPPCEGQAAEIQLVVLLTSLKIHLCRAEKVLEEESSLQSA